MRKVLIGIVVLLALVVGAGAWYLAPIGPIATGYAAQVVCGAHLISGRTVDDAMGDLPDNPLVPFLRVESRDTAVRATLLGAYESVARKDLDGGCSLPTGIAADFDAADLSGDVLTDIDPFADSADDLAIPDDPTQAAATAGFDLAALDAAIAAAFAEDPAPADGSPRERGTRAVVVVHRGTVVHESYGEGFDRDMPLLGWSMSKSVANAIAGSLVLDGDVSVDDTDVWSGWPAGDPRRAITIDDLLTMTDGLAFEEVYDPDTDATQMLFVPRDMAAFAADKPLEAEPGTRWEYSSGTTNILCEALGAATPEHPAAMAAQRVFVPLSMRSASLGTDASGDPVCSSFGYATALDWARFGLLYAQDGVWDGERLLPSGWVEYSRTPALEVLDEPYGASFWLNTPATDGERPMPGVPEDMFYASGNEGQHIVVIPSLDLVVVRLGLARGYDDGWGLEDLLTGIVAATPPA